jgi:hypothetical protein
MGGEMKFKLGDFVCVHGALFGAAYKVVEWKKEDDGVEYIKLEHQGGWYNVSMFQLRRAPEIVDVNSVLAWEEK